MIEVNINETPYSIRTNWNEITYSGYCDLVKATEKTFAERLSIYTCIPIEDVNRMKLKQFALLSEVVEFMDDFESVNAFAVGYESDVKISEQPYWKIEKAKQLLKDVKQPILVACEIVKLYTSDKDGEGGTDISDMPITEAIGMASFFLPNCQSSLSGSKG